MIKEYIKYLKNNPEGYWFKAKTYGWGWTPAKWQGWLILVLYIIIILLLTFNVDESSSIQEFTFAFALPIIILTAILIGICYKTGEKPRWQWGIPKEDKTPEDNF